LAAATESSPQTFFGLPRLSLSLEPSLLCNRRCDLVLSDAQSGGNADASALVDASYSRAERRTPLDRRRRLASAALYAEGPGTGLQYNPRWQAKGNGIFLFDNQVLDNIFWTFISAVPIWSAYEILTFWGQANGWLPYLSWKHHPVWFVLLMLAIPMWRDIHFYVVHRLIHWPPLYRAVHCLHHNNVNVGPWSGLAMHPVEHVLYYSAVLIHWIIPSHPLHVLFDLQHLSYAPAQGHSGFERIVIRDGVAIQTHDYYHYLHHKYFEVNYGSHGAIPTDILFGTFHDGSDEATERMNRRIMPPKKG
jgi:sterol desaturase/sphingolipid hydroxylase (fatty acid hydroxylase superfamily)